MENNNKKLLNIVTENKKNEIKDNSNVLFKYGDNTFDNDFYNNSQTVLDLSKILKTCFKLGQVFNLLILEKIEDNSIIKLENQHNSLLIVFNSKVSMLIKFYKELKNNDLKNLKEVLIISNDLWGIFLELKKILQKSNLKISQQVVIDPNFFNYFKEIRNVITHSHNYGIRKTRSGKEIIQIHFRFIGYTLEFIKSVDNKIETTSWYLQSTLSCFFDELTKNIEKILNLFSNNINKAKTKIPFLYTDHNNFFIEKQYEIKIKAIFNFRELLNI